LASFIAVYDACVLYPAPLRDLLLRLALADLFRVRWTDRIHEEWIRSVLAQRPDLLPEQLGRTRDLMDRAVPDCLVTGYEGLIDTLDLPDLDDRHVLAAAIRSQAGVIVTYNLRDFPSAVLMPHGVEAQHPVSSSATCLIWRPGLSAPRCVISGPPCSGQIGRLLNCLILFWRWVWPGLWPCWNPCAMSCKRCAEK